MCGIFGIVAAGNADISGKRFKAVLAALFTLSESRGKEAAGRATAMIRSDEYRDILEPLFERLAAGEPPAFTYDWGMVTDLARRNISRQCAALGVEHIVRSPDIAAKRRQIRSVLFEAVIGIRPTNSSPLIRRPGKALLTWLTRHLMREQIPDVNSGMRLMRRDVILRYLTLPNLWMSPASLGSRR